MNLVVEKGRLTKDPQISYTAQSMCIARFTIAVDRMVKSGEERKADFIPCTAFAQTAEFIEKYFKKGMAILVEGSINTGSYDKDGKTYYTWGVNANRVEFCEKKGDESNQVAAEDSNGFMNLPEGVEDELPFT